MGGENNFFFWVRETVLFFSHFLPFSRGKKKKKKPKVMLFLNLYENILVCQKLKTKYENTLIIIIIIIIIPSSIRIIGCNLPA